MQCGALNPEDPTKPCVLEKSGHADHFDRDGQHWIDQEVIERMRLRRKHKPGPRTKKGLTRLAAETAKGLRQDHRLTKEQGMRLAYEAQRPDRDNFEALIYYLAKTTPPSQEFSSNEVWDLWREGLGWPEPASRQFVGPAMTAAASRGWTKLVGKVGDRAGNGHSGLPNNTYVSLIYDPSAPQQSIAAQREAYLSLATEETSPPG